MFPMAQRQQQGSQRDGERGRGVIAGRRGLAVSQGHWGSGWGVMVAHGWRTNVLGSE